MYYLQQILWTIGSSLGGILLIFVLLLSAIRIVPEYQRAVVFRFGRLVATKGPALSS